MTKNNVLKGLFKAIQAFRTMAEKLGLDEAPAMVIEHQDAILQFAAEQVPYIKPVLQCANHFCIAYSTFQQTVSWFGQDKPAQSTEQRLTIGR